MPDILTMALAMATCIYFSTRNRDKRHFPNTKHEFAVWPDVDFRFVISSATKIFFIKEINQIQSSHEWNFNHKILMNHFK